MYNLIFVSASKNETTVHRINVITGDCLTPVKLDGELAYQVNNLVKVIVKDKPDKIVFDKNGYGNPFYYYFMEIVKYYPFNIDSFGLITYKEV